MKSKFNLDVFYAEISHPMFKGNITESQEIGFSELFEGRDDWTPAELASALAMAFHRTEGTMRNPRIRRVKYREPIVSERMLKLALQDGFMASAASVFQDALIKADWGPR